VHNQSYKDLLLNTSSTSGQKRRDGKYPERVLKVMITVLIILPGEHPTQNSP
jgi:hypothetical protein